MQVRLRFFAKCFLGLARGDFHRPEAETGLGGAEGTLRGCGWTAAGVAAGLACVAEVELPDDAVKIVGPDGKLFAAIGSLFCCRGTLHCQLRDMGGGFGSFACRVLGMSLQPRRGMRSVACLPGAEQQIGILSPRGVACGSNVAKDEPCGYGAHASRVLRGASKGHQGMGPQQDRKRADEAEGSHKLARPGTVTKCGHRRSSNHGFPGFRLGSPAEPNPSHRQEYRSGIVNLAGKLTDRGLRLPGFPENSHPIAGFPWRTRDHSSRFWEWSLSRLSAFGCRGRPRQRRGHGVLN
jgi:hypothetical protein